MLLEGKTILPSIIPLSTWMAPSATAGAQAGAIAAGGGSPSGLASGTDLNDPRGDGLWRRIAGLLPVAPLGIFAGPALWLRKFTSVGEDNGGFQHDNAIKLEFNDDSVVKIVIEDLSPVTFGSHDRGSGITIGNGVNTMHDPFVESRHFQIRKIYIEVTNRYRYQICDISSGGRGTHLNGRRLEPNKWTPLSPFSVIRASKTVAVFSPPGADVETIAMVHKERQPLREATLPSEDVPIRTSEIRARTHETMFPASEAFYRHYIIDRFETDFEGDKPVKMLKKLLYFQPTDIYGRAYDPFEINKGAYVAALRELALYVADGIRRGEILSDQMDSLPFGNLEYKNIDDIMLREISRFMDGSAGEIESMINRWRESDPSYNPPAANGAENSRPRTMPFAYQADIHGGSTNHRPTTMQRQAVSSRDFFMQMTSLIPRSAEARDRYGLLQGWLADFGGIGENVIPGDNLGNIGRFYFAVRSSKATDFFAALEEEVLNPAFGKKAYQAKVSIQPERYGSGDSAVVYFRSEESEYFKNAAMNFAMRHPEFLYGLERDTRPLFTAQMLDGEGRPIHGLYFGQSTHVYGHSCNTLRAEALGKAIRNERLLDILGYLDKMGEVERRALRRQLIYRELVLAGVDPENPAFEMGPPFHPKGIDRFATIYKDTDQGRRQVFPDDGGPRRTMIYFPPPALDAEIVRELSDRHRIGG